MKNFQFLPVFFLLGTLALQFLTKIPPLSYLFLIGFATILTFKYARLLSFSLLGFLWAAINAQSINSHQLDSSIEGQPLLVQGVIVGLPVHAGRVTQFRLEVDKILNQDSADRLPDTIKLSWYANAPKLRSGESWQLKVKLKRPHGHLNPHGFDYEKWLFQQGISATGYVRKSKENFRLEKASGWKLSSWRESLRDYLNVLLPASDKLAIIKALVLGDKSDISPDQWRVFRATGTSHLIAISGLHIGLVSALIFGIVRWLVLRVDRFSHLALRIAISSSLIAAMVYAGLAGFSIPTQRALLMLCVVMGGLYWQRYYRPYHVLNLALFAILIMDPLAVLSVGFWLSFAAVAIILYGSTGRLGQQSFLRQLLYIQCIVTVGLMPLVLYFFQQMSIVSPVANIFAVPWVSFLLVPLLMISLLISVFNDQLALYAMHFVDYLLGMLWWFLHSLSTLSFASWIVPSVSLWACVLAVLGTVLLLLPKGLLAKRLSVLFFLPLLFPLPVDRLKNGEFKLVLLDVGQGLSVVIHTAKHTLVFDTGAKFNEKFDMASRVLLPYLKGEKINKIDKLFISHGDNDHAGGVKTVLQQIEVKKLLTSVPEKFPIKQVAPCFAGDSWYWEDVFFEILHPEEMSAFDGNNASCVLSVSSQFGRILLPGDIEKSAEQSLIKHYPHKIKADVLVAAHHGSNTSSIDEFITSVDPSVVLFSVGYKNRFAFPKKEVVKRYKDKNIISFDSAANGAVTVLFSATSAVSVSSYRESSQKYWSWRAVN